MKLHLGCGNKYLEGYKHIDYSNYDHIDWKTHIYPLPFIKSNSVKEIYSSHALEYFDFFQVKDVLIEWRRCLENEGKLRLSVPDFDKLLEVYKKTNFDIDKIIGPLFGRWITTNKNFIYHKTVFTKSKLIEILKLTGFSDIEEWDPLIHFGREKDSFDDYSKAYYPHMNFDNGFPISINILGIKKE